MEGPDAGDSVARDIGLARIDRLLMARGDREGLDLADGRCAGGTGLTAMGSSAKAMDS